MKRKTKIRRCIPTSKILFWTVAGYAAYVTALYIWKRPACEYAKKLCESVGEKF